MSLLWPSRSFTVATSCGGSSGFLRKASAPAASACSPRSKLEMHSTGVRAPLFQSSAQRPADAA